LLKSKDVWQYRLVFVMGDCLAVLVDVAWGVMVLLVLVFYWVLVLVGLPPVVEVLAGLVDAEPVELFLLRGSSVLSHENFGKFAVETVASAAF
jgi:hypothetical protein